MDPVAERRLFLASLVGLPLSALHADIPAAQPGAQGSGRITREMLVQAARVADVSFTDSELDAMVDRVNANLRVLADVHALCSRTTAWRRRCISTRCSRACLSTARRAHYAGAETTGCGVRRPATRSRTCP